MLVLFVTNFLYGIPSDFSQSKRWFFGFTRSEEPYLALGPAAEGVPRFGNLEGPGPKSASQGDLGA